MKLGPTLLGVGFAHYFGHTRGFAINSASGGTLLRDHREEPSSSSQLFATSRASYVSVCTAELCCCQDDGPGGDEILAELQARNLPYTVDEAPCLGACGGGAMVAIDFEDGTSALVAGLQETLMELGLSDTIVSEKNEPATKPVSVVASTVEFPSASVFKESEAETLEVNAGNVDRSSEASERKVETFTPAKIENLSKPAKKSSTLELVDVRDRMRAEASKEDEKPVNPWLNAASYLAGKAAQQLFGSK